MKTQRVVVFAGHSGGHLFPALSFAEAFRNRFPRGYLCLVTTKKGGVFVDAFPEHVFDECILGEDYVAPKGISWDAILFLLQWPRAFFFLADILSRIQPDLCIGFGSFISYPGLTLSRIHRIPTMIHEQNKVPGIATKWLWRGVDCVCESFPGTFINGKGRGIETTGLPIRSCLLEDHECQNKEVDRGRKVQIMIMGGSQGAHRLNEVLIDALRGLSSEEKAKMAVKHITGNADFDWVCDQYRQLGIDASVFRFFDRMKELYREADFAITRAGAGTLFELALFGIPAIVVPYPYAGGHQLQNALFFSERKAVIVKEESKMSGCWLLDEIRATVMNESRRAELSENIKKIARADAAEELVRIACRLLGQNKK